MRDTVKTVDYNGRFLIIRFEGEGFNAVLDSVRSRVDGRVWVSGSKAWTAPPTKKNIETLKNLGFTFLNPDLLEHPEGSRPIDEGWKKLDIDFPRFKDLFPFQQDGVRFFEYRHGVGLNGDDMGLGKTIQAIGYLALHPELRPAVILCPATVKLNWQVEILKWTGERSQVLYGKKPEYLKSVPIYIINYDILCHENEGERAAEAERKKDCVRRNATYRKKKLTLEGWIDLLEEIRLKALIADESQMLANTDTLRSRGVSRLSKGIEKGSGARIFLSGTPIRSYPSEFFTTLNLIDPISFSNEYAYLNRYCNPKHNGYGWTYKGITNEEELRRLIEPLMIRRMKTEVLTDLPPKIRSVVPLDCDEVELSAYREAADEFKDWVKDNINKPIEQQQHIEYLKQLAYLAKRNSVIAWIKDFLSSGQKLIVFAYHTKALDDLQHEFKDIAVRIDGGTTALDRQKAVEKFQNNSGKQLFLGQIIAAGVGITLTASSAVAFVEFGWAPADHDQAEDRANRIGQKFCVNCYYLVAEGTVEKENVMLLELKRKITSGLLDGKEKTFFTDKERSKLDGDLGLLKFMLKAI